MTLPTSYPAASAANSAPAQAQANSGNFLAVGNGAQAAAEAIRDASEGLNNGQLVRINGRGDLASQAATGFQLSETALSKDGNGRDLKEILLGLQNNTNSEKINNQTGKSNSDSSENSNLSQNPVLTLVIVLNSLIFSCFALRCISHYSSFFCGCCEYFVRLCKEALEASSAEEAPSAVSADAELVMSEARIVNDGSVVLEGVPQGVPLGDLPDNAGQPSAPSLRPSFEVRQEVPLQLQMFRPEEPIGNNVQNNQYPSAPSLPPSPRSSSERPSSEMHPQGGVGAAANDSPRSDRSGIYEIL